MAPSLSTDTSLSSALSLESAHEAAGVAAHPAKNMTAAAGDEDVKLESTNLRRQSQKHGATESLAKAPATKERKSLKATAVEQEPLDREAATPVGKRVRRSRKTTETTTKSSTNSTGHESNRTKVEEEEAIVEQEDRPKRTKRTTKIKVEIAQDEEEAVATPKKSRKRTQKETLEVTQEAEVVGEDGEDSPKKKRRRKTKEEKEAEAMPLAARTTGLRMFLGAHVSSAKGGLRPVSVLHWFNDAYSIRLGLRTLLGVHNSVTNCLHIG